jgi:hypothetical protein
VQVALDAPVDTNFAVIVAEALPPFCFQRCRVGVVIATHERCLPLELCDDRANLYLDLASVNLTLYFGELCAGQARCETLQVGENAPCIGSRDGNGELVMQFHQLSFRWVASRACQR